MQIPITATHFLLCLPRLNNSSLQSSNCQKWGGGRPSNYISRGPYFNLRQWDWNFGVGVTPVNSNPVSLA